MYTRTIGKNPTPDQLDHLVDIYQSGRMYEEALEAELKIVEQEKTAEDMEVLGDLYYSLHRYEESRKAYDQAARLSDEVNPDILMKAAYSAMKEKQYSCAAGNFKAVIDSGTGKEGQLQAAMQNLAYIEKVQKQKGF